MQTLEKEIIETIANVVKLSTVAERNDQTGMSRKIKTALVALGRQMGPNYGGYAHSVDTAAKADWGEWLWDVVWAEHEPHKNLEKYKINAIRNLPLIAEIEWNTNDNEIALDFQKLVFGVADLKLYVFSKGTAERNQDIRKFCASLGTMPANTLPSKYLLIGVPRQPDDSEIYAASFEVSNNGGVREATLLPG